MSETKSVEKVVRPSALKAWIIAAAIIIPSVGYFLSIVMHGFGVWTRYRFIFPLPWVWMLVILYALRKFSPRLKITTQELTLLFVICFITVGMTYGYHGLGLGTAFLPQLNLGYLTSGLNRDPYKDIFYKNLPSFLVPKDPAVMYAFWYGGTFDLGAWIIPILFWIIWTVAELVGFAIWGYFLRKPLIEVERLPFPGIAPALYLTKYYVQEESGIPVLFNFRLQLTKLFWIGVIVGVILSLPGQIANFWPLAFGAAAIINWPVNLLSLTQGPLPGAKTSGYFYSADAFSVAQFIPLDALATAVLYWFVFGVIFQTIAVRVGWAPFTPGAGYESSYPWTIGPFKWMQFSWIGVSLGLATIVVLRYRNHIIEIFKKGISGEKVEDDGVSYQFLAYGAISTYLIQVVLLIIAGSSVIMAILLPAFIIFFMYGWTRMMGEVQEFMPAGGTYAGLVFDMGTFLGQWGPRPSPGAFNTMLMYYSYTGDYGIRVSSLNMHHQFKLYKMAHELNTSGRDVLYVTIIAFLSTIIAAYFIWPWFMTRFGGYSRINSIAYNDWSLPSVWSWTYGTPSGLTVVETWAYAILGIIITYIIYFLRARYAWFFINPVGLIMYASDWWPTWLVAFIVKYAILKFGGSRVFEEKWLPVAAGIAIGYSAMIIFGALIIFFGTALPAWFARF